AWLYAFYHVSAGRRADVPGAAHAAEIPYVFDTLDATPQSARNADADDRRLAAGLADCWSAFAKSGEPRCDLAEWHRYDASQDNVLWINGGVHEMKNPDGAVLDGIESWFAPGARFGP